MKMREVQNQFWRAASSWFYFRRYFPRSLYNRPTLLRGQPMSYGESLRALSVYGKRAGNTGITRRGR